jgi:hypothetical protein
MPTYRTQIEPALVTTGVVIPIWYDTQAAASDAPHPDAAGIDALPFEMFYRQVKGAPPDNDLWRLNMLLKEQASNFQRTLNFPPNAPSEAIEAFRAAMGAISMDEEYRADALRTMKFMPRFSRGPEVERVFFQSMKVDERLRAFVQDYAARGVAMVGK